LKNIRYIIFLYINLVLLVFFPISAPAFEASEKVFLTNDRDIEGMGVGLNDYLNKIKSKHGIIIYSGCNAQFGTEIFIVSNSMKQGLLLEFSGRQLENIAFVDLKDNDGILIDETMGGLWTMHRMQNNIDQIIKMPFQIFMGKNLADLFDMKFPGKCEDYKGR
jgi:hypothetical protein